MRIIILECKKALTSPFLISLFILFTAFNLFMIFSNTYYKDELKVVNEIAEKYGDKITNESLNQFQQDIQEELSELSTITNKDYQSIFDFLNELKIENENLYSEQEWNFFVQLQLKEMYFNMAQNIDSDYEKLDFHIIADDEIEKSSLSGVAASTLKGQYEKLSNRFEELKQNEEHKEWFFSGNPYRMHSFLFRTIFKDVIIEALILIVLATALITNFEYENKSQLITYSTFRGRRLMKDKLSASLLTSTIFTLLLFAVTLGAYFMVFDYSYLWGSSISSAFNWEYNLPYVSWWNLTFTEFLFWAILVIFIAMLLFSAITFFTSVLVKNSYISFFLFAAFFVIAFLLSGFMPTSSNLVFISGFNLSFLVLNPHMLFMGTRGLMPFKYFEVITLIVWTIIVVLCCVLSLKLFKKQEIH